MANIFQRIFLPKYKQNQINQQQEIMQLVVSSPIAHHAYFTKSGAFVRGFSIKTPTYQIYTERSYEASRPIDHEVQYSLVVQSDKHVVYATHSEVDKFTQQVYNKMYKIWDKNKQHAK